MKKVIALVLVYVFVIIPSYSFSQMPGKPTQPSLSKQTTNPFQKPPSPQEKPQPPIQKKKQPQPSKMKVTGVPFTLPGIVGIVNGQWSGSDNLFNLKPNIGIFVEIVMPEDKTFEVNEAALTALVTELFTKAGISPSAIREPNEPPLPLYHVLIMMNSVDQQIIASCSCRLFEAVTLKRVILEEGITYQAITWEKQELISATPKDFKEVLPKTIQGLTSNFVERFHYFQNLRAQMQTQ